jgi:hypothetical protein
MANTLEAGRIIPTDFNRAAYLGGSTNFVEGTTVVFDESNVNYVTYPDYSGQKPAGVLNADKDYGLWSGIQTKGKAKCIASEAIPYMNYVSIGNTSGQLKNALPGEPLVGRALQEAAGAGSVFEVELMIGCYNYEVFWYVTTAKADDFTFTTGLPAGDYRIGIFFTETAGNSLGGGIDVGTTNGGGEIGAALTCAASTAYDYSAGSALAVANGIFTLTENDSIYVTDADGTGWDSAVINFWMKFERVS